jgi:protein-tyrosine phosphatase
MIDLHIHLLPGIDDGPATAEGTVELARACVEDGVTALAVTPHVSDNYPTTPDAMEGALAEARYALAAAKVPLEIHGGAEVAIDRMASLTDDDLKGLTLGGSGKYMLLECPYAAWPMELEPQAQRLAVLDIRVILAHPERSAGVQADGGIDRLARAVERGVMVQLTAGSLSGRFGRTAAATASELIDRELVHVISSDAHNVDRRPPRMGEAAAELKDEQLAQWLTTDAPGAVLRGDRLPPRPERSVKKRKLFGRKK